MTDLAPLHYGADLRDCPDLPPDVLFVGRQWIVTTLGVESLDGRFSIAARHLRDGLADGRGHVFTLATDPGIDADDLAVALIMAIAMLGEGPLSAREALTIRRQAARRKAEAGGARRKTSGASRPAPAALAPDDAADASTAPAASAPAPSVSEQPTKPATTTTKIMQVIDPEQAAKLAERDRLVAEYEAGVRQRRAERAAARAAKRATGA